MSADGLSRDRTEGDGSRADELRTLWQEQPATAAALGEDALRAHALRVAGAHRRLRVLRILQPAGSVFGIAVSLFVMLRFPDPLMRAGLALLALTFMLQWIVPRRMLPAREAISSPGPRVSSESSLIAYRAALLYRLEADRGLRMWLRLAIGVPAAALLALTFMLQWIVPRRMLPAREAISSPGPRVSSEPSLLAYRAALLYRLEADRGLRMWLRLAIGVPAAALLLYGMARVAPALRTIIAIEAVVVFAALAMTVVHVVRRVRRYQAELDALDALETSL